MFKIGDKVKFKSNIKHSDFEKFMDDSKIYTIKRFNKWSCDLVSLEEMEEDIANWELSSLIHVLKKFKVYID